MASILYAGSFDPKTELVEQAVDMSWIVIQNEGIVINVTRDTDRRMG